MKMEDRTDNPTRKLNARMFGKLVVVAVMMFGFGYLLVPLYKQICELTGINILAFQETEGMKVKPIDNSQIDKSRTITVEFDANTQGPFRFRPTVSSMKVHPGEMTQVMYEVVNTQARDVQAQAIPSYAPQQAAAHFKKVECFCFQQQTLGASQAKQMPVVFYLDRQLPQDVKTITLSYTFFEIGGHDKKAEAKAAVAG
jgi:cytochrome c oxidase assembly protein subunit 11